MVRSFWNARKAMVSIKCKKRLAAGAPPRTPHSDILQRYPLVGGEGLAAPFQEPHNSRSRSFRPRALVLHLLLWYDKDSRLSVYVCSIVVLCVGLPAINSFLRSTNCTLETDISLMNHYVIWHALCIKKSTTRAQGRYLHAPKYLVTGAWWEAFEMRGKPWCL